MNILLLAAEVAAKPNPWTVDGLVAIASAWGGVLFLVFAAARIIVKLTPTDTDNKVLDLILDFCRHIGLHIPGTPTPDEKTEPTTTNITGTPGVGSGNTVILPRPPEPPKP